MRLRISNTTIMGSYLPDKPKSTVRGLTTPSAGTVEDNALLVKMAMGPPTTSNLKSQTGF